MGTAWPDNPVWTLLSSNRSLPSLDLYTRAPHWTPTVVIPAYLGPCPLGLTAGKKLGLPSFWEALPSQDLWKKEALELGGRSRIALASSTWAI